MEKHQKTTVSLIFYLCKIQEENVPSLTQNEIFLYIFARIELQNLSTQFYMEKCPENIVSMFFFRPTTVLC